MFRVCSGIVCFIRVWRFRASVSVYLSWDDLRSIFWMKTPERPLYGPRKGTWTRLDELTKVKVEGSDIRMTIAEVATAIVICCRKVTTGVGGLTFQPVVVGLADAPIVQHVAEGTIVVSIAGQGGGDEQIVGHDVLHGCVCASLASCGVYRSWFDGRS